MDVLLPALFLLVFFYFGGLSQSLCTDVFESSLELDSSVMLESSPVFDSSSGCGILTTVALIVQHFSLLILHQFWRNNLEGFICLQIADLSIIARDLDVCEIMDSELILFPFMCSMFNFVNDEEVASDTVNEVC